MRGDICVEEATQGSQGSTDERQGFALPRHHALHPNTKANDEATFNLYALYVFVLTTPLLHTYQVR